MKAYQKIIFWFFAILLFFVPLILWPFTSEVFEFNKMVLVYILTTLITGTWLISMITEKKFIFRRTILDIPMLIFIASQIISTVLSIDPLTSVLGYYSRFNGGLLSVLAYALLYWAFVSNLDAKQSKKLIYVTLGSATLVAIYGVLEHFGIDKSIWVQDVQSRVFSTLGQPNWLAAWLIALTPITWYLILDTGIKPKNYKFWIYFGLSVLFFWTTIFTKSRSGYLGFAAAFIIFWGLTAWQKKSEIKKLIFPFMVIGISIFAVILISGTELTPSIGALITKHPPASVEVTPAGTSSLDTGGTESSTIRKIVWKGAIQVWLHYPVFGTGVETFAYSYYLYRPAEHNLTSEWDFIYNKAHNEYLNFAANSGTVGLLAYLSVVGFSLYIFFKSRKNILSAGLLAGYISLLVTNFFGFSVVPTQLELFLFPAIAIGLLSNEEGKSKSEKVSGTQKTFIVLIFLVISYSLFVTCKYWYADTLFAMGSAYNKAGNPDVATKYLSEAINLEPNQPLYYGDSYSLASAYASLAIALSQQKETDQANYLANMAIAQIQKAVTLSPANVNFKRTEFSIYIMLSSINPNYLINARDTLTAAIIQAPTDAKLYYNLGLTYARIGQITPAIETLQKTIQLKSNYEDARLAYAILLVDEKQFSEAKTQLNYILTNIDPNNSLAKQTLAGIK